MTAEDHASPAEWPAWATERVEVVEADPSWQARGEQLSRQLGALLDPWLTAGLHHVGSTAIPGLAAKPIIDVMAGVADLGCAAEVAALLQPDNWHWVPAELDERDWRRFFVKVAADRRVAHLHLMRPDTEHWHDQLEFRDRLRAGSLLASRYADLKRRLAAEHPDEREAYTRGKEDFVQAVLAGREPGDSA